MVQGYGAMRLPVSILYGRGDRILDPHNQGEVLAAKLPGAMLTMVDGGHMLPITMPELVLLPIHSRGCGAVLGLTRPPVYCAFRIRS